MSRETEVAWAAGIIDGEGSIGFRSRKPNAKRGQVTPIYSIRLRVGMVDKDAIVECHRIFGGNVNYARPKSLKSRTEWYWQVSDRKASEVLREVLPYLVTKRKQAVVAIEFQREKIGNHGRPLTKVQLDRRESFCRKMMKLNRRGSLKARAV